MEKLTIGEFEVVNLGADSIHYFPGFGTHYSGFKYAVTGQGDTPAEALADALGQLWDTAQGSWDVAGLKDRPEFAEATEGWDKLPSRIPLIAEGDGDEEAPEGEPNPDWYHYVGIRWNRAE